MKKLVLIFILPFVGSLFGQVEDVRITADGTVINTKTVKFATGKLMVNGVAVVGGGVTSVTGTAPIVSSGGLTPAISITAATTGAPGSMSAADKLKLDGIAAGAQPGTVTSVAVSVANGIGITGSPITTSGTFALSLGAITPTSVAASGAVSGSNLSGTNTGDQYQGVTSSGSLQYLRRNLGDSDYEFGTLPDAAANGATKGVSTFTAADFNATTGNISLDYTNGQAATTSLKGFLTSADWNTFNGKVGTETDPLAIKIASNLSDLNNAGTARTNLGVAIGTNVQAFDADLTTYAGITPSVNVQTLLGSADFAAFRTSLSLVIGTNVQAWDADLDTWAGITPATKANLASPTFTGTVTIPTPFTLGAVSVLPTGTELNFVDGVTSSIQTQLDAKGPAPSDTAYDEATWNGVTTIAPSKNAVRDKFVLVDSAVAAIPAGPRVIYDRISNAPTSSTDGSEDMLIDVTAAGGTLVADGAKLTCSATLTTVASGTATRRIKMYLNTDGAGNELIWDSGALTLAIGSQFQIQAIVYRTSGTGARIVVFVTTTSASTVPYVTYSESATCNWANEQRLIIKGIAAGVGADAADITLTAATITMFPAGTVVE